MGRPEQELANEGLTDAGRSEPLIHTRFWLLERLCFIVRYIIRACLCLGKSSKVKPFEEQGMQLQQHHRPSRRRQAYAEGPGGEDEDKNDSIAPDKDQSFTVVLSTDADDHHEAEEVSTSAQKADQGCETRVVVSDKAYRSPRRHHIVEIETTSGADTGVLGRIWYSCDSIKDGGEGDQRKDQISSPKDPRTLVINKHLTATELESYLDHQLPFKLLTIEFDLRHFPPNVTSDSVFQILQQAFLHPNVQEFRIRIDNWRNHIHQQENLVPADDKVGPPIRTDYPMKLTTLIIYCPGVTLHHLFIYRGFILSQTNLSTLICNFDAVMWRFYKPILKALSETLTKLELYSITNYNGNSNLELFNWVHVAQLVNLKFLKIWGDSKYYGLRHRNLSSCSLKKLTEIELKYVDLDIEDIEHLLHSETLTAINLQFFSPIPGPTTVVVGAAEFIDAVAAALSEQSFKFLSFADHKLPGSIMDRHMTLSGQAAQLGYTSIWATPDNTYDLMTFQLQD